MTSAKAMTASQKMSPRNNGISVKTNVIQAGLFSAFGSILYISALIVYSFCIALSITVLEAYGSR